MKPPPIRVEARRASVPGSGTVLCGSWLQSVQSGVLDESAPTTPVRPLGPIRSTVK